MSKLIRRGVVAAALACVMGLASTSMAGVLGTISNVNDPNHDLSKLLNVLTVTPTGGGAFDFTFTGTNFSLIGSYNTSSNTVSGNFSASGNEKFPSLTPVSYSGVITNMDIAGAATGKYLFLTAGTNGSPSAFIFIKADSTTSGAADVSPVPLPSALGSGLSVLGLLAGGAALRRRVRA